MPYSARPNRRLNDQAAPEFVRAKQRAPRQDERKKRGLSVIKAGNDLQDRHGQMNVEILSGSPLMISHARCGHHNRDRCDSRQVPLTQESGNARVDATARRSAVWRVVRRHSGAACGRAALADAACLALIETRGGDLAAAVRPCCDSRDARPEKPQGFSGERIMTPSGRRR